MPRVASFGMWIPALILPSIPPPIRTIIIQCTLETEGTIRLSRRLPLLLHTLGLLAAHQALQMAISTRFRQRRTLPIR